MERIGCTSRNIPSGKAPKSLKTVKWSTPIHFVISRSCVRVTPPAPKSIESFGFRCFFVTKNVENVVGQGVSQTLTHTLTHLPKCAERVKEHRRGGFAPSGNFVFFCLLHLCYEAAHRMCGFILLLPRGVGVGSQGKACIVVPQHTADRFHVHTVL